MADDGDVWDSWEDMVDSGVRCQISVLVVIIECKDVIVMILSRPSECASQIFPCRVYSSRNVKSSEFGMHTVDPSPVMVMQSCQFMSLPVGQALWSPLLLLTELCECVKKVGCIRFLRFVKRVCAIPSYVYDWFFLYVIWSTCAHWYVFAKCCHKINHGTVLYFAFSLNVMLLHITC